MPGQVEDRRVTVSGIGKYIMRNGLAMNFKGKLYVVLGYYQAPNDHVRIGNPQEMTLVWAPSVPEDCPGLEMCAYRWRHNIGEVYDTDVYEPFTEIIFDSFMTSAFSELNRVGF